MEQQAKGGALPLVLEQLTLQLTSAKYFEDIQINLFFGFGGQGCSMHLYLFETVLAERLSSWLYPQVGLGGGGGGSTAGHRRAASMKIYLRRSSLCILFLVLRPSKSKTCA